MDKAFRRSAPTHAGRPNRGHGAKGRPKEAYPPKGTVEWIGPRFIVYRTPKGWCCTVSKADMMSGVMVIHA